MREVKGRKASGVGLTWVLRLLRASFCLIDEHRLVPISWHVGPQVSTGVAKNDAACPKQHGTAAGRDLQASVASGGIACQPS